MSQLLFKPWRRWNWRINRWTPVIVALVAVLLISIRSALIVATRLLMTEVLGVVLILVIMVESVRPTRIRSTICITLLFVIFYAQRRLWTLLLRWSFSCGRTTLGHFFLSDFIFAQTAIFLNPLKITGFKERWNWWKVGRSSLRWRSMLMGHALESLVRIKIPWASYRWRIVGRIIIVFLLLKRWLKASLWGFFTVLSRVVGLFSLYKWRPIFTNFNCLILSVGSLSSLVIFQWDSRVEVIV